MTVEQILLWGAFIVANSLFFYRLGTRDPREMDVAYLNGWMDCAKNFAETLKIEIDKNDQEQS